MAFDGVTLRPLLAADLAAGQALSESFRWPHRLADWEFVFRHGDGWAAERDGRVIGTAMRWRWGPRHATVGLVIVDAACQGRRIGHRLMQAVLDGLDDASVLLHASGEGRGLYERLGFVRTGELRQHQGTALPAPLVALQPGRRLRPAGHSDLPGLQTLDAQSRGLPRPALVEDLVTQAESAVVLDVDGVAGGYGLLRRFGRGHLIGPVVAPDFEGAQALIAHLSGLAAGRFTRIDVDFDSGLTEWVETLGLARVDVPTTMWRGPVPVSPLEPRLYAVATQALG